MIDRPASATLRITPDAIPAVRAAFEEAALEVGRQAVRLQREGLLREPWLGDETSFDVYNHYNRYVMQADDGPYAVLVAYEQELLQVRDTLVRMEDDYRRTEGDNAALWGRA